MLFKNGKDIVFTDDKVFLAIMLYFRTGIFAIQHNVTRLDIQGNELAVLITALADRNYFPLLRFFLCRIRDEQSSLLLKLLLYHLDKDTIS